jgi:hypothetical protein
MSRYIGKRVHYTCDWCGKLFSWGKNSVDDTENSGKCFCSGNCFSQYKINEKFKINETRIVGDIGSSIK